MDNLKMFRANLVCFADLAEFL